jgi:hypothetical protein
VALSVFSDSLPEQAKNDQISVLAMNARPSQFDDFAAEWLEHIEFKLLCGVIAEVILSVRSRLQAVSANNIGRWHMLDNQVVTYGIERVFVPADSERFGQPFIELEIKNLES